MEIVKKNLVSIICGVVALAAIVAVFVYPLGGFYTELKTKAEQRATVQQKIDALIHKSRVLPVFDPNDATTANLDKFPSQPIINLAANAQKQVTSNADKMVTTALELNERGHGLVLAGSLPTPISQPVAIRFRRTLQDALDHLRTNELLAGIPPTSEEFNNRADVIWKSMQKDIVMVDGQPTNLDQVMARYQDRINKLPDEMKKEMATKNKMYIDPLAVMRVSPSLPADGNSPTREAIWWSQVAFWVTRDVATAIEDVNADAKNVTDAPVKNLIALNVPEDFFPPGVAGAAGTPTAGGAANYGRGGYDSAAPADGTTPPATGGLPDPTIPLPDGSTKSPTKRVSNNLFDVVQFKMTLDIEADKIPVFLDTLATNRFITVTRMEMNPVDSQLKQIQGYVYGPKPVVTLDLDCEELFMRQWTIKYMPPSIRKALGIPDTLPGGGGAGTAQTRVGLAQ
jgi:hypothetical protein